MEPIEPIGVCDLCGKIEDECICPECDMCGVSGRGDCYKPFCEQGHGMCRSLEQIESFQQFTEAMDEAAEENAMYMEKLNELYE
jgi:hypothetical protein